jgi:hypothetical protein
VCTTRPSHNQKYLLVEFKNGPFKKWDCNILKISLLKNENIKNQENIKSMVINKKTTTRKFFLINVEDRVQTSTPFV